MYFSYLSPEVRYKEKTSKTLYWHGSSRTGKNISTSLRRKDYEPCKYFQTVTDLKNSRNICDVRENRYTHDREAVEIIFNTFHKKFIDNTCLTKE